MTTLTQTSFVPGWMIVVPLLLLVLLVAWGIVGALNEEPDETERTRPLFDWRDLRNVPCLPCQDGLIDPHVCETPDYCPCRGPHV